MASNYKRGRQIKDIADYESCDKDLFFVIFGLRHRGFLESLPYRSLRNYINKGMFVAERIKEKEHDS